MGGWRKPRNEELHNLQSSENLIRVMKSRMRLPEHLVSMGEMRNKPEISIRKHKGSDPLRDLGLE
jgi:hypothetical protein